MKSGYAIRSNAGTRLSCRTLCLVALQITLAGTLANRGLAFQEKLDINDASFLWPVAKTEADVGNLISMDDDSADGDILPQEIFDRLMQEAATVTVEDAQIGFPGNLATNRHAWKVVGIRVHPSAFGTNPRVLEKTGTVPGIRLIVQPVEFKNGRVVLHDIAAHVVFSFLKNAQPPFDPDRDAFKAAVRELQEIKAALKTAGVDTSGKLLGVHPGFAAAGADLNAKLRKFLKNHLSRARLHVISFMGIPQRFEPWIFFRVTVMPDGTLVRGKISGHFDPAGPMSQMLTFLDSRRVVPATVRDATAVAEGFGISTAPLFSGGAGSQLDQPLLSGATMAPMAAWKMRDIADLIANPTFHHTGNTDCVSCHTETVMRSKLNLTSQAGVAFVQPAGVSGVDPSVLPTDRWNIRDFGWGFNFDDNLGFHPTVTQRAANEAAEAVDIINREYLGP